MVAPASRILMTAAADDKAGGHVLNQSGLPPLVRVPTISYISFTAAVRPASRPLGAPRSGPVKSCGTKAVRDIDNVGMRGSLTWRVTLVVIIVNNVGYGRR